MLTISLPTALATSGLAIIAGSLISCASKKSNFNILVSNESLNNLTKQLNNYTSLISIADFNSQLNNNNENIEKFANGLKIDPNSIQNIVATQATKSNENVVSGIITINAKNDYVFINEDKNILNNVLTSNIFGEVTNNGKSIVFSNVSFLNENLGALKEISIDQNRLNDFALKIKNQVINKTIGQFNEYFTNNINSKEYINKIANELGIVDSSSIINLNATGSFDNATIVINAASGYKFVSKNTKNNIVSEDGASIEITNVVFNQFVTITNFANDINSNEYFITNADYSYNSLDKYPETSNNSELSFENLSVDIKLTNSACGGTPEAWRCTNYFSTALPNSVDGVFDINGLGLKNAQIKWKMSDTNNGDCEIRNDEQNKQYIYNKKNIVRFETTTYQLIAEIFDENGTKVANDVTITFNVYISLNVDVEKIGVYFLSETFKLNKEGVNVVQPLDFRYQGNSDYISYIQNILKQTREENVVNPPGPIPFTNYNVIVDLDKINETFKIFLPSIKNITWNAPTGNDASYFSTWNGSTGLKSTLMLSAGNSYSFSWTGTIEYEQTKYLKLSSTTITLNFSLSI